MKNFPQNISKVSKNVNRELVKLVENTPEATAGIKQKFLSRISQGKLTREENPKSHFGVYFLPFDCQTKEVFLIHHKKSGLWLSPGGHMEIGELPLNTLIRETKEELGLKIEPKSVGEPFLLTITPINNQKYVCQEHFDIWYLLEADRFSINADQREFHAASWFKISQIQAVVTDPNNLLAIGTAFKFMAEKLN